MLLLLLLDGRHHRMPLFIWSQISVDVSRKRSLIKTPLRYTETPLAPHQFSAAVSLTVTARVFLHWRGFIYFCGSCGTAGTTHTHRLIFSRLHFHLEFMQFSIFFRRNLWSAGDAACCYKNSPTMRIYQLINYQLQLSSYPNGIYFYLFNSTFLRQSAAWKLQSTTIQQNC